MIGYYHTLLISLFLSKKEIIITVLFLLIEPLNLSAAPNPKDKYQVDHIIRVIRVLGASVESSQEILPLSPDGTIWVYRPLESLQLRGDGYFKIDFSVNPVDSEERAFYVSLPPHNGYTQTQNSRNVNAHFFELRPLREVLVLEIEIRGSVEDVRDLNSEELRRISPETINLMWWNLANIQISWLTVDQLNWRMSRGPLAPPHKTWLTREQVIGISKENIQNTLDEFDIYRWWRWFSEEQISWLTKDQLVKISLNLRNKEIETPKGLTFIEKILN